MIEVRGNLLFSLGDQATVANVSLVIGPTGSWRLSVVPSGTDEAATFTGAAGTPIQSCGSELASFLVASRPQRAASSCSGAARLVPPHLGPNGPTAQESKP